MDVLIYGSDLSILLWFVFWCVGDTSFGGACFWRVLLSIGSEWVELFWFIESFKYTNCLWDSLFVDISMSGPQDIPYVYCLFYVIFVPLRWIYYRFMKWHYYLLVSFTILRICIFHNCLSSFIYWFIKLNWFFRQWGIEFWWQICVFGYVVTKHRLMCHFYYCVNLGGWN